MGERRNRTAEVRGSNPLSSTRPLARWRVFFQSRALTLASNDMMESAIVGLGALRNVLQAVPD